jgi:hypothetical protein
MRNKLAAIMWRSISSETSAGSGVLGVAEMLPSGTVAAFEPYRFEQFRLLIQFFCA